MWSRQQTHPRLRLAGAIRLFGVAVPTVEALVPAAPVRRVGHLLVEAVSATRGRGGDLRWSSGAGTRGATIVGGRWGGRRGSRHRDHRDTIGNLGNSGACQGKTKDY